MPLVSSRAAASRRSTFNIGLGGEGGGMRQPTCNKKNSAYESSESCDERFLDSQNKPPNRKLFKRDKVEKTPTRYVLHYAHPKYYSHMESSALRENVNAYALGVPKQPSLTERRGANVPTCTTHPKFEKERFFRTTRYPKNRRFLRERLLVRNESCKRRT